MTSYVFVFVLLFVLFNAVKISTKLTLHNMGTSFIIQLTNIVFKKSWDTFLKRVVQLKMGLTSGSRTISDLPHVH